MTTINDINQLIDEMKSNAINHHRTRVANLSHKVVTHPSDVSIHVQLQSSLKHLDFLMSA